MPKRTVIPASELTVEKLAELAANAEQGDELIIVGDVVVDGGSKWELVWGLLKIVAPLLAGISLGRTLFPNI